MRQHIIPFLIFLFLIPASGMAAPQSATSNTMSMDNMLEYTLTDLKNRMQDVASENGRLSERNNALRKRIITLRQELRNLENHKISLLEDAVEASDQIKLNTKELKILERKSDNVHKGAGYLADEQTQVRQQIGDAQQEEKKLQEELSALTQEVDQIHQDSRQSKTVNPKERLDHERYKFAQLIKEAQDRIRFNQQQSANSESRINSGQLKKDQVLHTQKSLQETLSLLEEDRRSQEEESSLLEGNSQDISEERKEVLKKIQENNMALKMYIQQLETAVGKLQETNRSIVSQNILDQERAGQFKARLESERQLLNDQQQVLSKTLDVYKGIKDKLKTKATLAAQDKTVSEQTAQLQQQQQQLSTGLLSEQNKQIEFSRQEKELTGEMNRLRQKLKVVSKKSPPRKPAVAVNPQLALLQRNTAMLKEQIGQWEKKNQQTNSNISQLKDRHGTLENSLQTIHQQTEQLDQSLVAIVPAAVAPPAYNAQAVEQTKAEIEALKMREEVLNSSLTLIKSRYETSDSPSRQPTSEENDLKNYLEVLKEENGGLQEKMLNLRVVLEQLQTQRSGLLGEPEDMPDINPKNDDSEPIAVPLNATN